MEAQKQRCSVQNECTTHAHTNSALLPNDEILLYKKRRFDRNCRGRFVSSKPKHVNRNEKNARQVQVIRLKKTQSTGIMFFEQFVRLIFIRDSTSRIHHWISVHGKGSTLLNLVDCLWNKPYLPPFPYRTTFFHNMFADWDPAEFKNPLPFISLSYEEVCNIRKGQKRVYKGFRLPYLYLKTIEIDPILEWVSRAQSLGILQCSEQSPMQLVFSTIRNRSINDNVVSYNVFDRLPLRKSKRKTLTQTSSPLPSLIYP